MHSMYSWNYITDLLDSFFSPSSRIRVRSSLRPMLVRAPITQPANSCKQLSSLSQGGRYTFLRTGLSQSLISSWKTRGRAFSPFLTMDFKCALISFNFSFSLSLSYSIFSPYFGTYRSRILQVPRAPKKNYRPPPHRLFTISLKLVHALLSLHTYSTSSLEPTLSPIEQSLLLAEKISSESRTTWFTIQPQSNARSYLLTTDFDIIITSVSAL